MGRIKRIVGFIKACLIGGVAVLAATGAEPVHAAPDNSVPGSTRTSREITVTNNNDDGKSFEYEISITGVDLSSIPDSSGIISGTLGDDILSGTSGADFINGWSGDDTIGGGRGVDTLNGDYGDDRISGADYDDILIGGPGNDTLTGGPGRDLYIFCKNDGNDVIGDYAFGADKIVINDIGNSFGEDAGQLRWRIEGSDLIIGFATGNGTITLAGRGDNVYLANQSDDIQFGPYNGVYEYVSLYDLVNDPTKEVSTFNSTTPASDLRINHNEPYTYRFSLASGGSITFTMDTTWWGASPTQTYTVTQIMSNEEKRAGWNLNSIDTTGTNITKDLPNAKANGSLTALDESKAITFNNSRETRTVTFDANGHGTAPDPQTVGLTDRATRPADPYESGWTFVGWYTEAGCINEFDFDTEITDNIILYAKWIEGTSQNVTPTLYKRLLQNNTGATPDMTFNFTFEQQSDWEGVSYVSTATNPTPIGDKSVTITSGSEILTSDAYVGNLTGKKLYQEKVDNVLSDFNPQVAGTYCYLVSEQKPAAPLSDVTYTGSQFIMLVEVEDAGGGVYNPTKVTNILYKDSAGKTKADYTNPPTVFDEKHDLIFYNTYGSSGGTTPTGIVTNILPFIVIGGAGVGGLVLYVVVSVRRRKSEVK